MIKFIRFNFLFLIGFFLSVSLVMDLKTPINKIDPKTKQFYQEYINYIPNDCKEHILRHNKIIIRFEALGSNFIGFCNKVFRERIILLDSDFWKWVREADQKQLLFHELSHCLINKNHVDDVTNYMYPTQLAVPEPMYIEQVKQDIETYCQNFTYD